MKRGYCYLCAKCCVAVCPTCKCWQAPTKSYREGFIRLRGYKLIKIALCSDCEQNISIGNLECILSTLHEDGQCLEHKKIDILDYLSLKEHDESLKRFKKYVWDETNLE